jgi:transglutaminase/protease-like cytokinesis protein 3
MYEHLVVWVSAGNTLPKKGELLHHEDEDGANNRIENLKLKSKSKHGADHISQRVRDDLGRLTPKRAAGRLLDGRTWDELPEPKQ